MKLLRQYVSILDAEAAGSLLEENGIATFISSKHSNSLSALTTGAFQVGLWVVLDEQLEDAQRLLHDPDHRVTRKLSRSEIIELKNSVRPADMSNVLKLLLQLLGVALLLALAVWFLLFR